MNDRQGNNADETRKPAKPRSVWRSLHSQPVMISLVLVLLVYMAFILAESFGVEGEGGWLGETIAAVLLVGGVIVIAVVLVGGALFLRHRFGAEKRAVWEGLPDTDEASSSEDTAHEASDVKEKE